MATTRRREQSKPEAELLRLWSKILHLEIHELTELDVLSCILYAGQTRQGSERVAYMLLQKYGNLGRVLSVPITDLRNLTNISDDCAILIKTVAVAAKFLLRSEVTKRSLIKNSQQLRDYCQAELAHETQEQFRVLFLDGKNQIIREEMVARGTVNRVNIYPREIIKNALSTNAMALLLIHNHPSGDATPSEQDKVFTKQLELVCAEIGIKLYDHVIVANGQYFSMFENGLLNQLPGTVQAIAGGFERLKKSTRLNGR